MSGGQPARELNARELFSLAFGAIVGVSWIVLVGQWIAGSGTLGAIAAFVIGLLLVLPIGHIYAKLGQQSPATGGEFVYAYRFFGARAAFGIAWVLALFYTSVCAFEAVSSAWLVTAIFPVLKGPLLYHVAGQPITLGDMALSGGFAIAMLALQLRGAQTSARAQDLMVLLLCGLAGCFIVAALFRGSAANTAPLIVHNGNAFLALLLATPLFYAGFGAVPQALGESSDAARAGLPRIIFVTLVSSMVFKVGVILATALVLGPIAAARAEFPVADAFARAFGSPAVANAALLCGVLGLLTTWNACFFSASRVLYALGNGALGPAMLARTSPTGIPRVAILLVFAVTLCVIPFGKQLLVPIITLGGIAVTLMFTLVSLCLLKHRRATGGAITLPVVGTAIALGLLLLNIYQVAEIAAGGRYVELMVLLGWVLSGVALWTASSRVRAGLSPDERHQRIVSAAA